MWWSGSCASSRASRPLPTPCRSRAGPGRRRRPCAICWRRRSGASPPHRCPGRDSASSAPASASTDPRGRRSRSVASSGFLRALSAEGNNDRPRNTPIFSSGSMRTEASSRISCERSATASTSRDFHFMRLGSGGGSPTIHKTWLPSWGLVTFHMPGPGNSPVTTTSSIGSGTGDCARTPHSRPTPAMAQRILRRDMRRASIRSGTADSRVAPRAARDPYLRSNWAAQ